MSQATAHDELGFLIRRCGKDEIEIRSSLNDGYFRGLLRVLILGALLVIGLSDIRHGEAPFSEFYNSICDNYIWTYYPEIELIPMYESEVHFYQDPAIIKKYNLYQYKIEPYEEYEKNYIQKYHRWDYFGLIFTIICILGVFILFFLPRSRGLILDRKRRIIYSRHWRGLAIAPVPNTGDPLSGICYNRFGFYMFGRGQHFSLQIFVPGGSDWHLANIPTLGVYPTPDPSHNLHLIKAMRAFFNEEEPEFMTYIGKRFRTPLLYPGIAFCNGLALPWPRRKKRTDKDITLFLKNWQQRSRLEKKLWFARVQRKQAETNEILAQVGMYNPVSEDWNEEDHSPDHDPLYFSVYQRRPPE